MKSLFHIVSLCIVCSTGFSQETLNDLKFYGDVMINAFESEHRARAGERFESLIDTYITEKLYQNDSWSSIKNYTRLVANKDSSVILLTWQKDIGSHPLSYGGYALINDKAIPLTQSSLLDRDAEYMQYGHSDWYGALYYNMRPLKGDKSSYLLFGYQQNGKFDKTKVADVLIVKEESIQFGGEHFVTENPESRDDIKSRKLLTYSSDTNASFNYNEALDMIIFDHLMPRMGQQESQGSTYVPDGTYEGYEWKNGRFVYQAKIFDHIYESAPRPEAILDNDKKDILGRSKN